MSNPLKKLKTDYGALATIDGETLIDDNNRRRKFTTKDKNSSIVKVAPTRLMDLNDDCLLEIFDRVGILDMCSTAESCLRFKDLMFHTFQRKHKNLKLKFGSRVSTDAAVQARRLFHSFGSQIVELEIQFRFPKPVSYSAAIMDAVVMFCTQLKSLTLAEFVIPDNKNAFVGIGRLFSKLEKLHLREVYIEGSFDWMDNDIGTPNGNLIDFFGNCPSLGELNLSYSPHLYPAIFGSLFPSLQHLIVEDWESFRNDEMENFIERHPNLKTFSLACEDGHIPFLAENCKSLQKLGFAADYHTRNLSLECLDKFHNVRELTCFAVFENMPTVVKELPKLANSLELLDLSQGFVTSDFIQIVSKLNKLKVFRFSDIMNDTKCILDLNPLGELNELTELSLDIYVRAGRHTKSCAFDLAKILNRLEKLTKLQFDVDDYKIPKATYLQLLNIVESRPVARNRHLAIHSSYIGTIFKDDCKDSLRATLKFAKPPTESNELIFIL